MKKKVEAMTKYYATQLSARIQTEPNTLFILKEVHTTLDFAKIGIPFGENHPCSYLTLKRYYPSRIMMNTFLGLLSFPVRLPIKKKKSKREHL